MAMGLHILIHQFKKIIFFLKLFFDLLKIQNVSMP